MTKTELIDKIAKDADISKSAAANALASFIDGITVCLKRGEAVTLTGFGAFSVSERAAREGRNPQTGAKISIAASRVPKFKAGKALKEAVL